MEGFVELPDGARLAFEDAGAGPVVTLLHPGLWDMRTWDPQIGPLRDAGFRVLRYDLRGYGRSSRLVPGKPYSNVRDLAAVLEARGVMSTALVGCSMGGGIAIDFTLTFPDRVWALVPVASAPAGFEASQEEDDWWEEIGGPIEDADRAGDAELATRLQLERLWAPLGAEDPGGRAIHAIAYDNLHTATMDESGAEVLDPPAVRRLGEIDAPTLVVKAGHDPAYERRASDVIAAGVVDGRVVQIDDADHVVNLRRPQAFDATVIPFLVDVQP